MNTFTNTDLQKHLIPWLCCEPSNLLADPYLCMQCGNGVALTRMGHVRFENLRDAFLCLRPEQRLVIYLKFVLGLSNQDVAEVLSKSIGAVKAAQRRALIALSHLLLSEHMMTVV